LIFILRTATKKISSLLFILLGFIPLLFVLFISLQKKEIRHRMEKELENGELQTIVVAENQVTWMDDHEIWVNNSMFDIATKKLENGIYTFTGLYDEEETKLVEKERKTTGNHEEQNKLLAQLFKSLPNFCNQQDQTADHSLEHTNYRLYLSNNPVNPFREILTPPPQA
jgi:hypothetical protein